MPAALSLFIAGVVAGCGVSGPRLDAPGLPASEAKSSKPAWVTQLGNAAVEQTVALPRGNRLGVPALRVERDYVAASGRRCRVLVNPERALNTEVLCERSADNWYLVRSIRAEFPGGVRGLEGDPLVTAGQ